MKASVISSVILVSLIFQGSLSNRARAESTAPYRVEEITVQAGDFIVAGDLYLPAKGAKHPAVVWVHGSGGMTRQVIVPLFKPQIEVFLEAGFAFFIDDIPGSGGSKGQMKNAYVDRAMILTKEIEALKKRPDIIPTRIGVAGMSQAGIVMPRAATLTSDIAFMIAESCVAEAAYEQNAYLLEQFMICEGLPAEEASRAAAMERLRYETEDYAEYVEAAEFLNGSDAYRLLELNAPLFTEDRFKARDKSPDQPKAYYDPAPMLAGLRFPILALFGEKDKNINPVQGLEAYRRAFRANGSKLDRAEMIANANHALFEAGTGCARELLAQVAEGKPQYGPKVLPLIAEWLEALKSDWAADGLSAK
jgi:pimeloyl-ACP methyl ester carboxylesterase